MASVDRPEDLSAAVVARINAGDLDGLVDLYEEAAIVERPDGTLAVGRAQVRQFYADLLQSKPHFEPGYVLPALIQGVLALTTTQIGVSASAEIARRQPEGGWRWVMDRPDVLRPPGHS